MLYRRRYVWVTVAACVAVVLAGLAAWKLTRDTPDGSARALADRLAARSLELAESEPRISRALAIEAGGLADTPTVQAALRRLDRPHEAIRLRGHTAAVTVIRYDWGGRLLASGDTAGRAMVWDTYTGQAILDVRVSGAVAAMVFITSSNRHLIAVAGKDDKVVRVYDVATAKLVAEPAADAAVTALGIQIVSGVGTWLATGDAEGAVRVWDIATWTATRTLDAHDGAVLGIVPVLTADERSYLVTGGADGSVSVFDAATGNRRPGLRAGDTVTAVTASNAGDVAMLAGDRVRVIGHDALSSGLFAAGFLPGVHGPMAFGSAGRLMTITSGDSVTVWQPSGSGRVKNYTGTETIRVVLSGGEALSIAAAAGTNTHIAAIGTADGTIRVWDLEHGNEHAIGFHREHTDGLGFTSDGSQLAIQHNTGYRVRPAGIASGVVGTPTTYPEVDFGGPLRCGAVDSSRDRIAACVDDALVVRDLRTGQVRHMIDLPPGVPDGIRRITFAAAADRLASLLPGGDLRIWDLAEGRLISSATVPAGAGSHVALSPDGNTVVVSGSDGMLRRYDAADPRRTAEVSVSSRAIADVAYHPGGVLLATGGIDGAVRLWDAATLRPVGDLPSHSDRVSRVLFSPDGEVLVSTGADNRVLLWQVADRAQRAELRGHPSQVRVLAFSADSRQLATHSSDGIRMWSVALEIGRTLGRACLSQPIWLSDSEWSQHVGGPRFTSVCRKYEENQSGGGGKS